MLKVDWRGIRFADRLDMQKREYQLKWIGLESPIRPGRAVPLELTLVTTSFMG
jgi:hypothetical protein